MKRLFLALIVPFLFFQCQKPTKSIEGIWHAEVPTVIGPIPFELQIEATDKGYQTYALNGDEKLLLDSTFLQGDTLHISMELFDAEIVAVVDDTLMKGMYTKKLGNLEDRSGEFTATKGEKARFEGGDASTEKTIAEKYAVTFTDDEGGTYESVGIFKQNGSKVSGTFLTTTGDYRYLAGNIVEDSLKLSCFDGTHIFLFKAKIAGDSLVGGKFCASLQYQETWEAVKDDNAMLPDATSLTYLKDGYEQISFAFPNTKGDTVRLSDERYKNKVVLVQILGSWCPNCMDESKFYAAWLAKNEDLPVEVIGLAFEKKTDPAYAFPKIDKMKERFGMNYEVLLAGLNSGNAAAAALPMLNHVMSFPTTIYIDKAGKVRRIHTGFSGPGTGKYYADFVEDFDGFVRKLAGE